MDCELNWEYELGFFGLKQFRGVGKYFCFVEEK